MNAGPSTVRDAITDEAAAWFVALRDPQGSGRSPEAFMAWLRQSPLHVEEYLQIAAAQRLLQGSAVLSVGEILAEVVREGNVTPLHPGAASWPSRRRPSAWVLAGAAALLAAVAVTTTWLLVHDPVDPVLRYATAHGERRTWTLADQSVVELDTDSELHVRYDAGERLVEVDRGRAHFQVARDPQRGFRVAAGSASIIATGTRFDVDRRTPSVVVTLEEGHVLLFAGTVAAAGQGGQALRAGERATIQGTIISAPVAVDLTEAEAWQSGRIVFSASTVAEVAAEFSRNAPLPLQIDDAALASRTISGAFDVRDTDSFLAYLQSIAAIEVERRADRILIHGRDAGTVQSGGARR